MIRFVLALVSLLATLGVLAPTPLAQGGGITPGAVRRVPP